MSIEDLESLQTLESMCSWSNKPPQVCPMDIEDHTVPPPTETVPPVSAPAVPAAQVFDLNDLLYLAIQIEDQIRYNNAELLQ